MQKQTNDSKEKQLEEQVVQLKSVVKVTKGDVNVVFQQLLLLEIVKEHVGIGTGKAFEVPDAIKKAIQDANKNMITIDLIDGRTIAHEVIGESGAARVMLKPAKEGTGIIAGGSVRAVLELAEFVMLYQNLLELELN